MKLQQLKYLLAIVDNGLNITAAADRLYTSQPGVSKQLKLLEQELGVEIFFRKGKSLNRVTRAGEHVVERARIIMREVERIRSLASDLYQESEGTLTVAATSTQARYVLPDVLGKLRKLYPKVRLNLYQGTCDQIGEMMSRSDIDFAVASGSHERFCDLLRLPGYQWDRVVVVPKNHELSRLDRPISLHDLARYPLASYVFSFEDEQLLSDLFADAGLKANIVFTARDADVVKSYVRMGLGIGIVAGMAFEESDGQSLARIPAGDIFPRSTAWVGLRKNTTLRCYTMDFLRLFAPHLSDEIVARAIRADSQQEIDQLMDCAGLPLRNGYGGPMSAAA